MPTQTRVQQELWLAADPAELSRAREFVERAAAGFGFEERERFELTFATNEAVTNAIEHGTPSDEGRVHLSVVEEEDALTFYVRDWGTFGVDGHDAPGSAERGRGLAFIAAMTDEFEVQAGESSTLVRLSKARS